MFFSLVLAVAAMSAVSFFVDRVRGALERQSAQLLAADLAIRSSEPIPAVWTRRAREAALHTAHTLNFRSMIGGEALQLVEVKAVSDTYPLRGRLHTADRLFGTERQDSAGPRPGETWPDARLAQALKLAVGERLTLGQTDLTVTRILTLEPDRGSELFNVAPRLMIHLDDVSATGLIAPGSRVRHGLLVAGAAKTVARLRTDVAGAGDPGLVIRDARDARPEIRLALQRAEQFLTLAALIAVALAGLALVLCAWQYTERHLDHAALLRCLGAGRVQVSGCHALQLTWLALLGSVPGCLLGLLAQRGLTAIMPGLVPGTLPPPSAFPWLGAPTVAFLALLGFCLPQLLRLHRVPPMRVLRRDLPIAGTGRRLLFGAGLLALGLLFPWQGMEPELTGWLLAGLVGGALIMVLTAWGLVRVSSGMRQGLDSAWRYGLAGLSRRPGNSVAQLAGIGAGIAALALITLVRGHLLDSWRAEIPPGTPNYFLINVQPQVVDRLARFLDERTGARPEFYPMIRARLIAIGDRPVRPEDYPEGRPRRLASREFNLSWLERLPLDNRLLEGRWWTDDAPAFSVERGIAQTFGIRLGDALRFRVPGGHEISAPVTSIRSVRWDSFRVNFFVAANPGWLDRYPATWIASFYLPPERLGLLRELTRAFPTITVLDVDTVIRQMRTILDRVALAMELVFGFTLCAGVLVMAAAMQTVSAGRQREGALLRALGASRAWLRRGHAVEFVSLGAAAGVLAALSAELGTWLLASQVLELPYRPHPWLWLAAPAASVPAVLAFGLWGTREARRQAPALSLRTPVVG